MNGFPNLFVDLDLANAPRFLTDLRAVQSKDDWQRFAVRYGILHNSEHFWPFYDWLNDWNRSNRGDVAGWLDLTYYDAGDPNISQRIGCPGYRPGNRGPSPERMNRPEFSRSRMTEQAGAHARR